VIRLLIRALKVLGWGVADIVLALLLVFLYYDGMQPASAGGCTCGCIYPWRSNSP